MAGYSGTPLARKLGLQRGHRYCLIGAPSGWAIPEPPEQVEHADRPEEAEIVLAFCVDRTTLGRVLPDLAQAIFPDRALWIAWPRRAAGHRSDLDENGIREHVLPIGLVDTKVAALDHDWSGLKVVWRKERR